MIRYFLFIILFLSLTQSKASNWPELPNEFNSQLQNASVFDSIDVYNSYVFSALDHAEPESLYQIILESRRRSLELGYHQGICKSLNILSLIQTNKGQFDSAQSTLYDAILIEEEHEIYDIKAFTLYNLGNLLNLLGVKDSALLYYDTAETLFLQQDNYKYIAAVNNSKALINKEFGNVSEAVNQFSTASKYMLEIGDKNNLSVVLGNLGLLYSEQEDYESAKKYLLESITLAKESDNQVQLAKSYMNLGSIYNNILEYDSALLFMRTSLNISQQFGSIMSISNAYYNIGSVFKGKLNYDSALNYYNRALEICEEIKLPIGIAYSKMGIADVYAEQGNFKQSNKLLNDVVTIGEEMNALNIITGAYKNIASNMKLTGDYKTALDYYERYISLKDSLMDVENRSTIEELKVKFETDLKERENLTLKAQQTKDQLLIQQKNTLFMLSGLALVVTLVLVVILYVVYRRSVNKNHILAKNKADLELKNSEFIKLNAALNESNHVKNKVLSVISHDMRSPLASLKGGLDLFSDKLISENEFKSVAIDLSQNLSTVLAFSENLLFWAKEEMQGQEVKKGKVSFDQILSDTVDLYKNDIANKNIELDISQEHKDVYAYADKDHISIVVRNLVSNAIKFSPKNGQIRLEVRTVHNEVCFSVSDQGKGISKDVVEQLENDVAIKSSLGTLNEKGLGLGLTLCRNYLKKNGSSLSIESEMEKGTKISFILPQFENFSQ